MTSASVCAENLLGFSKPPLIDEERLALQVGTGGHHLRQSAGIRNALDERTRPGRHVRVATARYTGSPMRRRLPSLVLGVLFVLVACNGQDATNPGGQGFPYVGPSCDPSTNNYYGPACWQCSQAHCSPACETTDCADYFQCFCACDPNGPNVLDSSFGATEDSCQAGCESKMTAACAACRNTLGGCEAQYCGAQCCCLDAGAGV